MPNGSPDSAPGNPPRAVLILPCEGRGIRDAFLLLPGLNLHPERLAPWQSLLTAQGCAVLPLRLTGFRTPRDPMHGRLSAPDWLDDLDQARARLAAELPAAELPGAELPEAGISLCGYSLGALLGLVWCRERGIPLQRAILIAPALRLKLRYRLTLSLLERMLPPALRLPSRAPREYCFHSGTTVAAYRALRSLERSLSGTLADWLAGRGLAGLPRMLIVYHPGDELIDTRVLGALREAAPDRVSLHTLAHRPRRGFPRHLGLDAHTLGTEEWMRLRGTVIRWLGETRGMDAQSAAAKSPSTGAKH